MPGKDELVELTKKTIEIAQMNIDYTIAENYPEFEHKDNAGDSVICLITPLTSSNFVIHTWPQFKHVSIQLYTCGDRNNALRAMNYAESVFKPKKSIKNGFKCGPGVFDRGCR